MANSYALNFNGSSRIVFGRDTMNATNTLTLEFWMNVASSDYSVYRSIVSNRDGSSATANYEVGLIVNSGNMFFYNGTVYDMGYKPPINTWVHVAYKVVNNTLSFYVNGALSKTVTGVALGRSTSMDFAIGAISSGGIQPFIGKIDDVRLWNIQKSSDEIMNNYKKNLSGAEDGLIGYFPFEEGTGTQTVNKKLGNSLIGSIISPNWITAEVALYSYKFLISSEDKFYSITSKYKDNAIPAMTSNTSPSGIAEASSTYSTFYPWKAFDKIVDQNGWVTASGVLVGWLSYEFPSVITITGYSIKSGTTPANRLPKNWTFEGWDGTKWIILDSRVNEPNFGTEESRFYVFINKIAYKKYRINVTANQGAGDFLSIGDFGMYESNKYVSYVQYTERDFIINGMIKGMVIELNDEFSEKRLLVKNNFQLGSGKVFKQKIDTTKIPISKASIT